MEIRMDPGHTIYAAIDTLLSLVAPEKAIMTSVEVTVTSKKDHEKSRRRVVHFIFDRPHRAIAVYWAAPDERVMGPNQIKSWKRSANNDGVQVVGGDGIYSPLYHVADKLLTELSGNPDDYEFRASWLLGQPKAIKLNRITKLNKKEGIRYKIETENVPF